MPKVLAVLDPYNGIIHFSRMYGVTSGLAYYVTNCGDVLYDAHVLGDADNVLLDNRVCADCIRFDEFAEQLTTED